VKGRDEKAAWWKSAKSVVVETFERNFGEKRITASAVRHVLLLARGQSFIRLRRTVDKDGETKAQVRAHGVGADAFTRDGVHTNIGAR